MEKIITGVEFAILVGIVIGIAILLHVLEVHCRIKEARRQKHDDDLAYEEVKTRNDFKEALAHYNDTEHEFDSRAQAEQDRQARSRQAIRRAQQAARDSMRKP